MDLKGIISISGMSGLYKIVATNKNGFIVESFSDKKRFAVSSAQRVSTLEDITIYTEEGDVPLKDVLKTLDEKAGKELKPDPKADPGKLKKDMEMILPDYDKERVYNSDIKKLFTWYELLKESDFSFEDEPEADTKTDSETVKKSAKAGDKNKESKATAKKESKTTAKKSEKEEEEKAPAKKKTTATKTKKAGNKTKAKSTEKSATKTKTASPKTSKSKSAKTPATRKK